MRAPDTPDQGGSIIYAEGVHYFPNGFTAAADVRLTSNLAFRQVFSDGVQQIISPIEVSQAFVNKSWDNYELNLLARSQVISIPNVRVKSRNLPSVHFEKRPSIVSFLRPLYFSFQTSAEGVSRREEVDDLALYRQMTGGDPTITPAIGQRFDVFPQVTLPINSKYFNFTATAGGRVTYYSNSFNDMRQVVGRDVIRKYGEFQFDVRPVALAKNFYGKDDAFKFRHVIEPFVTYRYRQGRQQFPQDHPFRRTRHDHRYERDRVWRDQPHLHATLRRGRDGRSAEAPASRQMPTRRSRCPNSRTRYFDLTVRGKYFFDKTFGGALIPGRRNQIEPITAVSFYTFGGVPRRFSPLNIDATYRPTRTIFLNTRMDVGIQGEGLRAVSATIGYDTPLLKFFQTFLLHACRRARSVACRSIRIRTARKPGRCAVRNGVRRCLSAIATRDRTAERRCSSISKTAGGPAFAADQFALHGRLRLRLLLDGRAVLYVQRRRAKRKPTRLQLPPQRHRQFRH